MEKNPQQIKQDAITAGCRLPWVRRWVRLGAAGCPGLRLPLAELLRCHGLPVLRWQRPALLERVGERGLLGSSAASEMPLGPGGLEMRRIPGSNPQGTSISASNCFLMAR